MARLSHSSAFALRALLAALVLVLLCPPSTGHGFLSVPKSRNLIANQKGQEYCEHCLSAGGPGLVSTLSPGGKFPAVETTTTAVRHTMCGEAASIPASQRMYNPAPVPTISSLPVYAPGQVFDMDVKITAHHRGHFEFRLCDAAKLSDPKTVTWACLDEHVLQRVSVPGEVSPVDARYPERYYLEPECAPGYNKTVSMRYRMPTTVTCERCVLQWWWITANSCNPPGYANRSPQPAHVASGCQWWESDLPACVGGWAYPEEFWNCADVRVAGTTSPAPAVGHSEPPAPRPAPRAPPVAPKPAPRAPPAAPKPAPRAPPAAPKAAPKAPAPAPKASEPKAPVPAPRAPPAAPKPAPKAPPAAPKPAPRAPPAAPKAPPAAPMPAPKAPAPAPRAPSAQTCAGNGFQCGGSGWTGTTCCASGFKCYAYIGTYSQCRSSCPVGWLCAAEKSRNLLTSAVDWVKASLE